MACSSTFLPQRALFQILKSSSCGIDSDTTDRVRTLCDLQQSCYSWPVLLCNTSLLSSPPSSNTHFLIGESVLFFITKAPHLSSASSPERPVSLAHICSRKHCQSLFPCPRVRCKACSNGNCRTFKII